MNRRLVTPLLLLFLLSPLRAQESEPAVKDKKKPAKADHEAKLLSGTRQLTFEGRRSGEGYFSADGSRMVFQSEREAGNPFYQIYLLDLETGDVERVSPGHGKTTCAWIHPSRNEILYASTEHDPLSAEYQKKEYEERASSRVRKYSWDYDPEYELYLRDLDSGSARVVAPARGYDAEGSISPDGKTIVFSSNRHAYAEGVELSEAEQARLEIDKAYFLDLYSTDLETGETTRLTDEPGYDGGPFFSADGERICWRRFSPKGDTAEIFTAKADGSDVRQLTRLGAMSWAPYFHPSGEYLVFTTNLHGFANFELYLVRADGKGDPVRVTGADGFDGLPVFTPDGKSLSWTSGRNSQKQSQIYLAGWNHAAALEVLGQKTTLLPEGAPDPSGSADVQIEDLRRHLEYLASDALDGRLTGTPGEKKATAYVAAAFEKLGLEPAGTDGSYFQPFEFTAGVELGDGNELHADFDNAEDERQARIVLNSGQWRPLSLSGNGPVEGAGVVFAGYGIELPEEDGREAYSSYFHLDVKDKWVAVLRYQPADLEKEDRPRFRRQASLRYKALEARKRGAKGLIVISGPTSKVVDQLVPLSYDASLADSGLAAISVVDQVAATWFTRAGKDLAKIQKTLDTGQAIAGFDVPGLVLGGTIDIRQEKKTGRNVIARLPGNQRIAGQSEPALVIGAHVDHLGSKLTSSSRATGDEIDKIHNGADDNASGVAAVLEIAEYLAGQRRDGKLDARRDVLFGAWSGEELGLLGSAYFVREAGKSAAIPEGESLAPVFAANLNLDMIGRLDKALVLQGIGSSPVWTKEIERRNAPIGLPLTLQTDSYVPTDATSFYVRGVPILNAFTGAHADYHTPSDEMDKINYEGAAKTTRLFALIARALTLAEEAPAYVALEKPENQGARGFRVYLGTVPDYAQGDIVGVKLSGVAKLGPAAKAGVLGGDVIVGLAGQEVKNIYDYTYVLGELKVGEAVEIIVEREGEEKKLSITPGSRD